MQHAAGAILVLPDGRWVLQRRTVDAPTNPNTLSFFGGKTERGETPEQTLRRELSEETDLAIDNLAITPACEILLPVGLKGSEPFHGTLFRVEIPNSDFTVFEGQGAEAYNMAELATRTDLSPVAVAVLDKLRGDTQWH